MADLPVASDLTPVGDVIVDNLIEPPALAGPLARGFGAGVAGVKSSLYGAGALAAGAVGAKDLEQAALKNAAAQSELASTGAMQFEDVVKDPTRAFEYFKWLLGNAAPSLGIMAAGGVAGAGLGALAGRGTAATLAAIAARATPPATRAGAFLGAVAPDVALEAGGIYPEALRTGVENPALRAAGGGAAAAALDFIPLLAAERYLKPLIGVGGFGAMLRGAAKGAPVGAALEGSQELGQAAIERAAAGAPLTGPEAISDYINSFAGGAAPGLLFGAGIGGRRGLTAQPAPSPVQEPAPSTEPVQPPELDIPAQHAAAVQAMTTAEVGVEQARAAQKAASDRLAELTAEKKLDFTKRRPYPEIDAERKTVQEQARLAKAEAKKLEDQWFAAKKTVAELTLQVPAVAETAGPAETPPASMTAVTPEDAAKALENVDLYTSAQEAVKSRSEGVSPDQALGAFMADKSETDKAIVQEKFKEDAIKGARVAAGEVDQSPTITDLRRGSVAEIVKGKASSLSNAANLRQGRPAAGIVSAQASTTEAKLPPTESEKRQGRIATAIQDDVKALVDAHVSSFPAEKQAKVLPEGRTKLADTLSSVITSPIERALVLPTPGARREAIKRWVPEAIQKNKEARRIVAKGDENTLAEGLVEKFDAGTLYSKGAQKTYEQILATQRAIEGLTSAVRDPKTGTVYTGKWHEDAINSAPVEVRGRLRALITEKGEDPDNVGFIQEGEFATRAQVERTLESRAGLTQVEFDNSIEPVKFIYVDAWNRTQMQKGTEIRQWFRHWLGDDPNLIIKTFQATPDSPIGSYTRVDKYKAVITAALNASDRMSLAAHEGTHYAMDRLFTNAERTIVTNALKIGRPMRQALIERAQRYDRENKTNITDEISARQFEPEAYAFQFWRIGELRAEGVVRRLFQKLQDFFERVKNLIDGLGFQSLDSIFTALDRGQFAERGGREQYGLEQTEQAYVSAAASTPTPEQMATMSYEDLSMAHDAAIDHNRQVENSLVAKYYPQVATEFPSWSRRKRDAWMDSNLLVTEEDELQLQYAPDELIAEFRGAINDFDTETPTALGRSIAVRAKNVDTAGFFDTPDGATVRDALRYAESRKWDMDKVLGGMRSRANEWAGSNAPEMFARLFKLMQDVPATSLTPDMIRRVEGGVPLFSRGAIDHDFTPQMENDALKGMARRAAAGEVEKMQENRAVTELMESANSVPWRETLKRVGLAPEYEGVKGGLSRWWNDYMSTPNFISAFSEGFGNVYRTLDNFLRFRATLLEKLVRERIPEWYHASFSDQDAAFSALLKRSLEKYKVGSLEYNALYDPLTESQKRLFDSATNMVAGLLNAELTVDREDFKKHLTSPGAYDKWLAGREAQVQRLKEEGYIPFRRYGDHTVRIFKTVTDAEGATRRETVALQMFGSSDEAELAARIYKAEVKLQGVDYKVEVGIKQKNARESTPSVQQFLDTLRRQGVEVTQTERERLVLALTNSESMLRNQMMHREGIPGFSKDGMRVLNEFGVNTVAKIAYSKFGSAIDAAAEGRAVTADVDVNGAVDIQIDYRKQNEDGAYESAADYKARNLWAADGPKSGYYFNRAAKLTDFVLTPDHSGTWSRNARAAAMIYFIGGSISSSVVNVMSIPMLLVPQLSVHTGYTNGLTTAMGAWKLTWQHQAILRDITRLKNLNKDPNNALPGIDEVPGLRDALIAAADKLQDTELYQIMGISQGQLFAQSRMVRRAMDVWMAPFRISEQTNRITSFIAGYKIGQENGLTGTELFNFARKMVDSTQNNYSLANRPGIATSPIGATLFVFKSFPLFMVEAAVLMYKANPRSAIFMLLGLVAMTGVQGLPFAEAIENLIDTIAQRLFNSPFNTRRAMKNILKDGSEALVGYDLSEVFMHGMINELLGVSASSRIGAGDFVPGTRLGTADADQGKILSQVLGAPYAMIHDVMSNAGKLVEGAFTGDWKQAADALRAGGPVALRNVIKGVEQFNTGYASNAKGQRIEDVNSLSAILQMTGLASAGVAKAYQYESIITQTQAFYNQFSRELQADLVRAMKDGDSAKVQEIADLRNAWNRENPEMQLMPNPAATRRAVILSGMTWSRREQMMLPRRMRGAYDDLLGQD